MKINHFICPNCGHDFYSDSAYTTCDACGCFFYVRQSRTVKLDYTNTWTTTVTNPGVRFLDK